MQEQDLVFNTNQGIFTYRVAAIIIKDKKLLMAKHEDYPCYYTVGGKVRINETSEEASVRLLSYFTMLTFCIAHLVSGVLIALGQFEFSVHSFVHSLQQFGMNILLEIYILSPAIIHISF